MDRLELRQGGDFASSIRVKLGAWRRVVEAFNCFTEPGLIWTKEEFEPMDENFHHVVALQRLFRIDPNSTLKNDATSEVVFQIMGLISNFQDRFDRKEIALFGKIREENSA